MSPNVLLWRSPSTGIQLGNGAITCILRDRVSEGRLLVVRRVNAHNMGL